ncbi:hypothetical protein AgCh_038489 [Apium graveolens]
MEDRLMVEDKKSPWEGKNVNPPEFEGEPNPVTAGAWLKEMEKSFNLVQVSDNFKTDYASYFLRNEVNYWWESTRTLEGEGPVLWARFTELFLEKSFSDCLQSQMEIEFLELKQADRSVAEYEAKFTELARFVPDYAALVIEFDHKLAAREKEDKKRKIDDIEEALGQEGSSQKSQKKVGRSVDRMNTTRQNERWKIQESPVTTVAMWGMLPRTVEVLLEIAWEVVHQKMPRRFFRGSQGRVPVSFVSGSFEVVVLDHRWSVELLYYDSIVQIIVIESNMPSSEISQHARGNKNFITSAFSLKIPSTAYPLPTKISFLENTVIFLEATDPEYLSRIYDGPHKPMKLAVGIAGQEEKMVDKEKKD